MAITSLRIVSASIKILNRDGIQGLTMRALADELKIKAASLYWHIKDKQELYTLITEHTSSDVDFAMLDGNPKSNLVKLLCLWRSALLKIRDSAEIVSQTFPTTENRIKLSLVLMDTLAAYGVKTEYVIAAAHMLSKYVVSFVADESHLIEFVPTNVTNEAMELFLSKYPTTIDLDEQFLYGLSVIIAGFEMV